ncbi:hypothetical protein PGT21_035156 [Puccinia graminis f. sp. tritici]|nr:hypothetical protein PGT21_035156 [Puccinia graminis f. sp. tritici]
MDVACNATADSESAAYVSLQEFIALPIYPRKSLIDISNRTMQLSTLAILAAAYGMVAVKETPVVSNLTTSPLIGGPVPGWRKLPSQSEPPKKGLAHNVGVVAWKRGVGNGHRRL